MDQPLQRRDARRVFLEGEPKLRFQLRGESFDGVPMGNISHGGCLVMLPEERSHAIQTDDIVEGLAILHPGIHPGPIRCRVAWVMGGKLGDTIAVGLQFLEMSSETRITVVAAVDAAILAQG